MLTRYCKSCEVVFKTQISLFIAFIAAFLEWSVFLSFFGHRHLYIPTDTLDHFIPLRACAARGKNKTNLPGSSSDSSLSEIPEFTTKMMSAHEIKLHKGIKEWLTSSIIFVISVLQLSGHVWCALEIDIQMLKI